MTEPTSDAYLEPYRVAARDRGPGFAATLWHSRDGQQLRFEVMARLLEGLGDSPLGEGDVADRLKRKTFGLTGRRVLDAGSGHGDLAAWMTDQRIAYASYVGIDGVLDVVEHATKRGLPRARFEAGDFVAQPDLLAADDPQVIVLSGTLNTMPDEVAMRLLEGMWAAASEAIAFNFLSDTCEPKRSGAEYPARRLPTMRLLDWAMRMTPMVRFCQDYFPGGHDATIVMRKPDHSMDRSRRP